MTPGGGTSPHDPFPRSDGARGPVVPSFLPSLPATFVTFVQYFVIRSLVRTCLGLFSSQEGSRSYFIFILFLHNYYDYFLFPFPFPNSPSCDFVQPLFGRLAALCSATQFNLLAWLTTFPSEPQSQSQSQSPSPLSPTLQAPLPSLPFPVSHSQSHSQSPIPVTVPVAKR